MSSFTKCIMDLQNTNFLMNRAEKHIKNNYIVVCAYNAETDPARFLSIWLKASLIAHPCIDKKCLLEQQVLIGEKYLPGADTWVAYYLNKLLLVLLVFLEPSLTVLLLTLTNKDVGLVGNWSFTRLN